MFRVAYISIHYSSNSYNILNILYVLNVELCSQKIHQTKFYEPSIKLSCDGRRPTNVKCVIALKFWDYRSCYRNSRIQLPTTTYANYTKLLNKIIHIKYDTVGYTVAQPGGEQERPLPLHETYNFILDFCRFYIDMFVFIYKYTIQRNQVRHFR